MNCHEVERLLDSYLDGELDLVSTLAIEQHLQACSACTRLFQDRQALQALLQASPLSYKAPEHLRKRLQTSGRRVSLAGRRVRLTPARLLVVAAMLLLSLLATWSLVSTLATPSATDLLANAVLASHIRSLQSHHLLDIVSTDRHTVKPWFDGKLDYSPVVIDLAQQGFPLIGGRLDYLDDRPVAALVYTGGKHIINLFTWPSPASADAGVTTLTRQGYHLLTWTRADMIYWAVSDMDEAKLQTFAHLLQQQITESSKTECCYRQAA